MMRTWEAGIIKEYYGNVVFATSIFVPESGFPFVRAPEGAFFGFVSAKQMIGRAVPDSVILLDGRIVSGIQEKVGAKVFETDVNIAYYLIYAAEVVVTPGSGFAIDATLGMFRVSFATTKDTLAESLARMTNAAKAAMASNP